MNINDFLDLIDNTEPVLSTLDIVDDLLKHIDNKASILLLIKKYENSNLFNKEEIVDKLKDKLKELGD
jgi:hypothetical protein